MGNMDFFLDKIEKIMATQWMPEMDDVLKCKVQTSGIIEKNYQIQGREFNMFDVGGQRTERRKWLQLFDDVNALVFWLRSIIIVRCYLRMRP